MAKPKRRLPAPIPEVVTAAEAAAILRVSESTIIRAIRAGLLPSFRLARRHLIARDALLRLAFRQLPAVPDQDGGAGSQTARLSRQEAAGEEDA